jgi:hypothetical protein
MISKSKKVLLGLEDLLINFKDNIFLDILDISMDYILKMYMEKTLLELLANALINEIQLALISKLIKSLKQVIKINLLNLISEEIN